MTTKEPLTAKAQEIARIQAEMPEPLKILISEVSDLRDDTRRSAMLNSYQIGVRARKAQNDLNKYGDRAIPTMSLMTNISESELFALAVVAEAYTSREVEAIAKRRMKDKGGLITINHLKMLAAVRNSGLREKMLERVFNESLSVESLHKEIQNALGKRGNNRSGRPILAPASPMAGLRQMVKMSSSMLRHKEVWEPVFDGIKETPPDELTERTLDLLDEAAREMGALSRFAAQEETRARAAAVRVKKIIEHREGEPEARDERQPPKAAPRDKKREKARSVASSNGHMRSKILAAKQKAKGNGQKKKKRQLAHA